MTKTKAKEVWCVDYKGGESNEEGERKDKDRDKDVMARTGKSKSERELTKARERNIEVRENG